MQEIPDFEISEPCVEETKVLVPAPESLFPTSEAAEEVIDLTREEVVEPTKQVAVVVSETVESAEASRRSRIETMFAPSSLSKRAREPEDDEDNDSIPDINMD